MSVVSAEEALLSAASRPFEDAIAMPSSVYTCPDFLARENDRIFSQEWICVGRSSTLAETGDYLTCEIADQPVLVLRDGQGQLKAFSNVCLHRMSTLLEGTGRRRSIVCPYHAWTYNLDGSLRAAPFMDTTSGFCKEDYHLPTIRCEEWLGWIYVTLNKDCPSVNTQFADLEAMIGHYGMADYVECFRETHVWNTNWKVLAENFMESYHLPVCHAATVGGYSKLEEMDCPPGHPRFNYHWITKEASLAIGNAHPDNGRLTGDQRRTTALITLYPGHLITLTPGYFWYLSLRPSGVDKVSLLFGGGLAPEFMRDPDAATHLSTLKDLLDQVNEEDRGCTEKVFKGLSSPMARSGHLSYLERPLYDFMQYVAAKTVGFQRDFVGAAE